MLLSLLLALLLLAPAWAGGAPGASPIALSDPASSALLVQIMDDSWAGTWQRHSYSDRPYDEIRLAELDEGYLPMISGEGDQDVQQAIISEVIFRHFSRLPAHSGWVKAVENLGAGHDPAVGADYQDSYFHLDSVFMDVAFIWRIYRVKDAAGRDVLWFEKLDAARAGRERWAQYQGRVAVIRERVAPRWVPKAVVEPESVFGAFVVEPGQVHASRVSFAARLVFGPDDSWLAAYATKLPSVLRVAIGAVFEAAVAICVEMQAEG